MILQITQIRVERTAIAELLKDDNCNLNSITKKLNSS